MRRSGFLCFGAAVLLGLALSAVAGGERRFLYVAVPGVRNYLERGGHGLLVFDIDDGHRFVKRIACRGLNSESKPENVKGICANAATGLVHIATLTKLQCLDLVSDGLKWERAYPGGCDRMALSPDGRTMYLPTLEKDDWHVIDAVTGEVRGKISPKSGAHNTVWGPAGKAVYCAGLRSPMLTLADPKAPTILREAGPLSAPIRPFTVNGSETLAFCCVNDLLGFEVADLETGKLLHRVEVPGKAFPVARHGCPSHGIALTPDEREIWVAGAHDRKVHVFDAKSEPPKLLESIALRDEPGWVTMSIDGRLAWLSTGEVIDIPSRKIVAALTDEDGRAVHSEKLIEIDFKDGRPVGAGCQFGLGQVKSRDQ
ncbi:MAG: YncE family protein [Verrucomicrobiales bacterium]